MLKKFKEYSPTLASGVFVDETALVIGNVSIGEQSSVWPMTVIRGDVNRITIGRRTNIQDGSVIHVSHQGPFNPTGHETVVGDDVTVGHRVVLHGCAIEDRSLIGIGAVVMDGAVIESDTMIAARSVVTPGTRVTSGMLWLGTPARPVRALTDEELEKLKYSANYYAELAQLYT